MKGFSFACPLAYVPWLALFQTLHACIYVHSVVPHSLPPHGLGPTVHGILQTRSFHMLKGIPKGCVKFAQTEMC